MNVFDAAVHLKGAKMVNLIFYHNKKTLKVVQAGRKEFK